MHSQPARVENVYWNCAVHTSTALVVRWSVRIVFFLFLLLLLCFPHTFLRGIISKIHPSSTSILLDHWTTCPDKKHEPFLNCWRSPASLPCAIFPGISSSNSNRFVFVLDVLSTVFLFAHSIQTFHCLRNHIWTFPWPPRKSPILHHLDQGVFFSITSTCPVRATGQSNNS